MQVYEIIVIIFVWNVHTKSEISPWKKNATNQVYASYTRKEIKSTMEQQTNKRRKERTDCETTKCCFVRSLTKMAQFTVILWWEFFILRICFLLWVTDTHSHTCLFILRTHLNLRCIGSVSIFNYTTAHEIEIASCCRALLLSFARSVLWEWSHAYIHFGFNFVR